MSYFTYETELVVERHLVGKGIRKVPYTVVWLPEPLKDELDIRNNPRLRVTGEINDHPFNGAWQPAGDDRYYLMVPKSIQKETGLSIGDMIVLRFNVADQNEVELPDALINLLDIDEEFKAIWLELTPGKQRSFAYRVSSAKTEVTVQKRIAEVTKMVKEGLFYTKGGKIK
ncbi:MAG: YdeI/OmpD-associated family protein [Pseudomonadota bacterium]